MSGGFKTFSEPGSSILRDFRAAMQARRQTGLSLTTPLRAQRSFVASQSTVLSAGWPTWDASINSLLRSALPVLKARSRHWSRNTGQGRRFLNLVRNGGVGPAGFPLRMQCGDWVKGPGGYKWQLDKLANDAIEAAWLEFCQAGNCDASGKFSFGEACRLQLEMVARDGEFLGRHLRGAPNKWRYQVQLLATDRLDHSANADAVGSGNEVVLGVERSSVGRPEFLHVLRANPLDARGTRNAERVPAGDMLHGFVAIDPEQVRGVPWSHAVLLGSHMLAGFSESAVFAARAGASQMGFLQQTAGEGGPLRPEELGVKPDADGELSKELRPGAVDLLPPGVTFVGFDPKYPSDAFGPFTNAVKQDIAAGLNVAHHNLSGDMTGVNYSSARIAELAERDGWRGVAHWFIGAWVVPVFREWLQLSLLASAIRLPSGAALPASKLDKYLAGVQFRGRGWDWVDPLKEVNAARIAREEGFTTRTQVVAAKGGDFEDNVAELAQESEILAAHGVTLGAAQAGPPPQKAAPVAANPEEEKELEE